MKYVILLTLLGLSQIVLAFINYSASAMFWLFIWSGAAWVLAGMAYVANAAWIFGKASTGAVNWLYVVAFFPFLFVTHLIWHIQRLLTKESVHNEIVPGIWLGRRCYDAELPPDVKTIVDMTSEFIEPLEVRQGRAYICVPTLDASAPALAVFRTLMESVSRSAEPIYIHCAKGHGRSAMVVIAALMAKGIAPSLVEAERIVKQSRPGIKISTTQRRLLEKWSSGLSNPNQSTQANV